MDDNLFELPDARQVSHLVNVWAAADPGIAAALRGTASTVDILAHLGFRLSREGRVRESLDVLRAAVALAPRNSALWLSLAMAADQAGLPTHAARYVEGSLALADQQPVAWLLLGHVRFKASDLTGAEAAYRASLRLDSEMAATWQCLGLVKQAQGEWGEAIECFTACMAKGGESVGVLANLGKLYYQTGRFSEAVDAYAAALRREEGNANYLHMSRRAAFLRDVINGLEVETAIATYQRLQPLDAPTTESDLNAMLHYAIKVLSGFGHLDSAARVGRCWLEREPGSASASYLLKAVTGVSDVEQSPEEYIVDYFDAFAEDFDRKLVEVLHYDLPAKLCAAINKVTGEGQRFNILDAGCGTGLCGPLLKPLARTLTGVDLSPGMLEQARRRGIYDRLICEELLTFLRRSPGQFDLLVAAEVFLYFGDLRPIWDAAWSALQPGGLLAFSTEVAAGDRYCLQTSGRFAHSLAYVRSTIEALFEEHTWAETTVRWEAGKPVQGHYYVLRRPEQGRGSRKHAA